MITWQCFAGIVIRRGEMGMVSSYIDIISGWMRLYNNVVSLVYLLHPTYTGPFSPTQEVS